METAEDREAREFWEEQARLPLFKRDSLWWLEVGLSTVAVRLLVGAFVVGGIAALISVL